MPFAVKRAYREPSSDDGYRVLVDRLWPRGVSKEKAQLDEWAKELAPSNELRKWIHEDPERWDEFRARYFAELEEHEEALRALVERAREGTVTLVFSAKDEERNNATVLREYLEELAGE